MNVFGIDVTVEQLVEYCQLSEAEIASLKACASNSHSIPPEGRRSAYVKRRLKKLNLVQPLWCDDAEHEELFFTWQRTPPGERLVEYYGGSVQAEVAPA